MIQGWYLVTGTKSTSTTTRQTFNSCASLFYTCQKAHFSFFSFVNTFYWRLDPGHDWPHQAGRKGGLYVNDGNEFFFLRSTRLRLLMRADTHAPDTHLQLSKKTYTYLSWVHIWGGYLSQARGDLGLFMCRWRKHSRCNLHIVILSITSIDFVTFAPLIYLSRRAM